MLAAAIATPGDPGTPDARVALTAVALIGVGVGRFAPFDRWRPTLIFALAIVPTVVAMFAFEVSAAGTSPLQRAALAVLVGFAGLRGVVHGDPAASDRAIAGLVRWGPVLLGAAWLLGLAISGPARPAFMAAAFDGSLLFIAAAALGLGAARLTRSAVEGRRQPRTDRAWLVLVLVVGGAALVGLPIAALVGLPLASGITGGLIAILLALVGLVLGLVGAIGALFAALLVALLGSTATQPSALPSPSPLPEAPPPQPLPAGGAETGTPAELGALVLLLVLVVLVVVAWYLARRWQGARGDPRPPGDLAEQHSFRMDLAGAMRSLRLAPRPRRRRPPAGALEAYPRLVDDWAGSDARARVSTETPAAHAGRLRAEGSGDLGLDLLVADFELARFAGTALTAREDGRAVTRWRRLRHPPASPPN